MIEIGRMCIKLAGRDAGRECVIVDVLDSNFVLIDGNTRRRKCNILHIEPTQRLIKIKKNASHEDVKKEFAKLGIAVWETKQKQATQRPKKQIKAVEQKKTSAKPSKEGKKAEKKAPLVEKKEAKSSKKKAAAK